MTNSGTSTAEFFEAKYQQMRDPWNFASSRYELDRYSTIIAALEGRRYDNAFEPGCSVGVLTEQLAKITDRLLAVDIAPSAAAQASSRCQGLPGVEIQCAPLADGLARGGYDLIVLSEVGYYYNHENLQVIARSLAAAMRASGTLLAVHWLGQSEDHQLSGDAVHDILRANVGMRLEHSERHAMFRLDRWINT